MDETGPPGALAGVRVLEIAQALAVLLQALALGDERIVRQLEGQQVMKVIVRAPKVVSIAVKPLV